jgi:hypothetical protein
VGRPGHRRPVCRKAGPGRAAAAAGPVIGRAAERAGREPAVAVASAGGLQARSGIGVGTLMWWAAAAERAAIVLLRWPRVNRAWDTGPGGATGHRPSATPKWPDEIEKQAICRYEQL